MQGSSGELLHNFITWIVIQEKATRCSTFVRRTQSINRESISIDSNRYQSVKIDEEKILWVIDCYRFPVVIDYDWFIDWYRLVLEIISVFLQGTLIKWLTKFVCNGVTESFYLHRLRIFYNHQQNNTWWQEQKELANSFWALHLFWNRTASADPSSALVPCSTYSTSQTFWSVY